MLRRVSLSAARRLAPVVGASLLLGGGVSLLARPAALEPAVADAAPAPSTREVLAERLRHADFDSMMHRLPDPWREALEAEFASAEFHRRVDRLFRLYELDHTGRLDRKDLRRALSVLLEDIAVRVLGLCAEAEVDSKWNAAEVSVAISKIDDKTVARWLSSLHLDGELSLTREEFESLLKLCTAYTFVGERAKQNSIKNMERGAIALLVTPLLLVAFYAIRKPQEAAAAVAAASATVAAITGGAAGGAASGTAGTAAAAGATTATGSVAAGAASLGSATATAASTTATTARVGLLWALERGSAAAPLDDEDPGTED